MPVTLFKAGLAHDPAIRIQYNFIFVPVALRQRCSSSDLDPAWLLIVLCEQVRRR
jgi:hypothetical protein